MQRLQTGVAHVHVDRRTELLVPCCYGEVADRLRNRHQSCGAMIPFKPKHPCPECGNRQINAHAPAPPPGDPRILDGDVALIDQGQVVAVQAVVAQGLATRLATQLRRLHWDAPVNARNRAANEGRLSGIVVTHRTFGFVPPTPLRRRYACSRSRLDVDHPDLYEAIGAFAVTAEDVFSILASDVHDRTARAVREAIAPAWLMRGTPWTSGIINHTAALPYHKDSGNIVGSWSAMLGCRRNVTGGLLHLVDYDVWLTIPHGSISIFDGQSIVHGVTPLRLDGPNAWRFTLVTYAKRGLRVCAPNPADEPARAALATTIAEDARVTRP